MDEIKGNITSEQNVTGTLNVTSINIPADYNELKEDVSELKGNVEQLDESIDEISEEKYSVNRISLITENAYDNNGSISSDNRFFHTNKIEVPNGYIAYASYTDNGTQRFDTSGCRFITAYNEDGTVVTSLLKQFAYIFTNNTGSTKYLVFSGYNERNNHYMVEVSDHLLARPSDYEPYTYSRMVKDSAISENIARKNEIPSKISELINDSGFISENALHGKKWYALGDSITQQNFYTSYVAQKTGLSLTNYGVGGTRLADTDGQHSDAMCYRYANMSDVEPDIVTVMGGSNDCYYSTIGTVGQSGVDTVAGAVKTIIEGLSSKYPNATIIFLCMPIRLDNLGFKPYADIVKDTCAYYGIPCVDVYGFSGLNSFRSNKYYLDQIHPNAEGGKRIGELLIDQMKKSFIGD